MRKWSRLLRQEHGAAMVMTAISLVMIFAFAVLAIDLSLIQLAKNQLQNAADAAALAAAIEYGVSDGDFDVATAEAIEIAGLNEAVQVTQQPVVITAADVTFPGTNQVRVQTHRTVATADPVKLYFLRVLNSANTNQGNMTASAVAQIMPVNGTNCLKPWIFPDMWDDADNDSLYDVGEYYDPDVTGYKVPEDVGRLVTLKFEAGGSTPKMGWYQPIRFGPVNRGGPNCNGADCYRTYISECEPYTVMIGDTMEFEMGNMVGPTRQGWNELVNKDPDAYFNTETGAIEGSAFSVSPRLIKVALYDPTVGVINSSSGGAEKYTVVTKLAFLFIEAPPGGGNTVPVTARFVKYTSPGEACPECTEGFIFTARLIE